MAINTSQAAARFASAVHAVSHAEFVSFEGIGSTNEIDGLVVGAEIADWYRTAAPNNNVLPIYTRALKLTLYSPHYLRKCQVGYRWPVGREGTVDPLWNEDWVVIGDWESDPLIADVASEGTRVLVALHGSGDWQPKLLAPTLAAFLEAMAVSIEALDRYSRESSTSGDERRLWERLKLNEDQQPLIEELVTPIIGPEAVRSWFWPLL